LDWPLIVAGLIGSTAAALATGLGALPVFFVRELSPRTQSAFLGFAAGVMLTASFLSLLEPALQLARQHSLGAVAGHLEIFAGLVLGALAVIVVNRFAPHDRFAWGVEGVPVAAVRRTWLIVIAIALHNIPEGLAVGVSFGGPDVANGTSAAVGIGLQNLPEGLAVAAALVSIGYSRWVASGLACLTGMLEPVSGFVGILLVTGVAALLPAALAFAAGAMVWVVSAEIIPETHLQGHRTTATGALMTGLLVMVGVDAAIGGA
jgi:zinc transporter, ZIP family